jgi:hypothetical protein
MAYGDLNNEVLCRISTRVDPDPPRNVRFL